MLPTRQRETVAVIGASPKPERYSHTAMRMLREYGHQPVPINPGFSEILGERCYPSLADVPVPIDTVTLYVGRPRSARMVDQIMAVKPRRIIMNPGAENDDLAEAAHANGIEVIEGCTLVMLRGGTF
jgi:predicted CoA-binding protein